MQSSWRGMGLNLSFPPEGHALVLTIIGLLMGFCLTIEKRSPLTNAPRINHLTANLCRQLAHPKDLLKEGSRPALQSSLILLFSSSTSLLPSPYFPTTVRSSILMHATATGGQGNQICCFETTLAWRSLRDKLRQNLPPPPKPNTVICPKQCQWFTVITTCFSSVFSEWWPIFHKGHNWLHW